MGPELPDPQSEKVQVTPFDPGVGVKVPVKVTVGLAVGVEVGVADGVEVGVTVGVSVGAFWQTPPAP